MILNKEFGVTWACGHTDNMSWTSITVTPSATPNETLAKETY